MMYESQIENKQFYGNIFDLCDRAGLLVNLTDIENGYQLVYYTEADDETFYLKGGIGNHTFCLYDDNDYYEYYFTAQTWDDLKRAVTDFFTKERIRIIAIALTG